MCGIAGIVSPAAAESAPPVPRHFVSQMLAAIAHRGPDERAVSRVGSAVFGTARLAQVDKPTSKQPMSDEQERYLLSFNGEIFNHADLRRQLEQTGVAFRTTGDTEVLLQALITWGVRALTMIQGQFALAFYDRDHRRLLLARDRFGIVPLFYTTTPAGDLVFASEVKALPAGGCRAQLSVPDLVDAGVLWGLHPGRSAFAGVRSVPPGSFVCSADGELSAGTYWSFRFAEERDPSSLDEQAERLADLAEAAVRRRVPVYGDPAVLVSGGLDSSAVLALLRRVVPNGRIDSYSIQFAQAALDEAPFQLVAAQAFDTAHHAIVCGDTTVAEALVQTILHAELPLVRTAPASSMSLAAEIEANSTRAVLSGEGADELFCGYDLFKIAAIRDAWSAEPDSSYWPDQLQLVLAGQRGLGRAVERAFYEQGLDQRADPVFSHLNRWRSSFRMTQYLAPDVRAGLTVERVLDGVRQRLPAEYFGWSAVEQAQYLECRYLLSSALLASQCDRPYMAHSIEARYPFLDEDVIDFALTLPQESKLTGLNEKAVLKRAVGSAVPAQIVDRVKQPYTAPEGDVFRCAAGAELLANYLSPSAIADVGLFDPRRVAWLLNKVWSTRTSFHDDLALLWVLSSQVLATTYGVADAAA